MTDSIQELERKISEEQTILARYEEMEQLESEPRALLKLQKKIERTKILVLGYQTRLAELRTGSAPKPRTRTHQTSALLANAPYGLESGLVGRKDELLLLDDWFHNDRPIPSWLSSVWVAPAKAR